MVEKGKIKAVAYERISSREQAEGYSLDAQGRERAQYAEKKGQVLVRVWSVVESAKDEGRSAFNEMLEFVKKTPDVKVILVEKVDRMVRTFGDAQTVIGLVTLHDVEVHFFHENWVFHKKSPVSDYYRLGFMTVVATGHTYDLSDKVRKGMNEKALQGEWPERAPFGYLNDKATKLIVPDPKRALWVRRIKELSVLAVYSLDKILAILIDEGYPISSHRLHRNLIERIIRNPIYTKYFEWPKDSGTLIKGIHEPIVSWEVHESAVRGLERFNRPRYRKWNHVFKSLFQCGVCPEHRVVTSEIQKGIVYYHCTGVRKNKARGASCSTEKYAREDELDQQVIDIMRGAQITPKIADMLLAEMAMTTGDEATARLTQETLIKQEIGRLENRIRKARVEKYDRVLSEEDWAKDNREWQEEKVRLEQTLRRLAEAGPASYLPTVRQVLELSKSLELLYNSATVDEKRELITYVCSNRFLIEKKIEFTYKKPFDLLAEGLRSARWLPG